MSVGRKVFHCVVDDTALTANISEIKKWTAQEAITLIVPLYTLERLRAQKKAGSQVGINAREAVRFLDRVTSGKHTIPADKVVLQGPMEQFEIWEEAERYFLPEFKEQVVIEEPPREGPKTVVAKRNGTNGAVWKQTGDLNEMSQMLLSKLNFKKEEAATDATSVNSGDSCPTSPMSGSSHGSPEYSTSQLDKSNRATNGAIKENSTPSSSSETRFVIPPVPEILRPLLNAVLWRLHAQPESVTPPSSCILVTNDRSNQTWAQKFGITAKTVPQLRMSIIYEEKEFKNHCKYLEKTQAITAVEPTALLSYDDESDEDVLVFVPRGRGKGSRSEVVATPRGSANNNNHANHRRKMSGNRVASGQPNGIIMKAKAAEPGAATAATAVGDASVEVPTVPIDPDSFSRNIGTPKGQQSQKRLIDISPTTPTNHIERGGAAVNGSFPRGGNGGARRGSGPRGGGAFRGNGRGRGRLWNP